MATREQDPAGVAAAAAAPAPVKPTKPATTKPTSAAAAKKKKPNAVTAWFRRTSTAARAFSSLYWASDEQVDKFLKSYELFDKEAVEGANTTDADKIMDYYGVLNHLCSLGEVERMYIPPVVDEDEGIFVNQDLFEEKMCRDLELEAGERVLDVGCGRGRIAAHVAQVVPGVHVSGINIEPTQLKNATENAKTLGLADQLDFRRADYNDLPLPFEADSFDAAYNVQALSYIKNGDFVPLFQELFRVLKPGAMFSSLEWVKLPAYDETNPEHRDLLRRCKALIGAVYTPAPEEFERALKLAGFEVVYSGIPSKDGHQYQMVEKAIDQYTFVMKVAQGLVKIRVLPRRFSTLLDRFNRDGETLVEGDKKKLWTTVWQVVARKPLDAVASASASASEVLQGPGAGQVSVQ